MKRTLRSLRRMAAFCAAILLAFLLTVPALADAWVPPDNHYNYGFETDAGARLVSLFISNYAETGMTSYSTGTPVFKLCPVILKDLELNASQFKEGLSFGTDASGVRYMTVTADKFEQRAGSLFPASGVRASDCPGYSGGNITVTASHENGPIDIAATVDSVSYEGDYVYVASFTVWRVNVGSLSAVYGNTRSVPDGKVTQLTTGSCHFEYTGNKAVKNISTWELGLVDYQTESSFDASSAVLEQNAAYSPAGSPAATAPDTNTAPVDTVSPDEGYENDPSDDGAASEPAAPTESQDGKGFIQRLFGGKESGEQQSGVVNRSAKSTLYLVIVLAVVVIVLLAVLIIVVVIKKR